MNKHHMIVMVFLGLWSISVSSQGAMTKGRYQRIVDKLHKADTFDYGAVGIAGIKSRTFAAFEKLARRASKKQITALFEHPSPIVRAYAWKAFLTRYPSEWLSQALPFFDDSNLFTVQQGCIVQTQALGDLLFEWYQEAFRTTSHKSEQPAEGMLLTELQKEAIFNQFKALKNGPSANSGRALADLLQAWSVPATYAVDLRQLIDLGMDDAFIPLAKQKDASAIPLFLDHLKKGQSLGVLKGIALWPHDDFFAPLLERHTLAASEKPRDGDYLIYRALVAYPRAETKRRLMEITTDVPNPKHPLTYQLRILLQVITSSSQTLAYFEDVLLECARRGHLMNRPMWVYLASENPAAATELMTWFIEDTNLQQKGDDLDAMMQQLARLQPPEYVQLMNVALRKVSVYEADHILTHLLPLKHKETFDVLVTRLDGETNESFIHLATSAMKRINRQRAYAFFANQPKQ